MTGATRIRWEPVTSTTIAVGTGHVGLLPAHSRLSEVKAVAEHWLEEHIAQFGAVFDLASTFPPEVSTCRFCNALLRRDREGQYADIDLANPEPWQCSGRYVASPGGRHKPIGTAGDKLTEDREPR